MLRSFEQFFQSSDAPSPQVVADAYLELIRNPRGQRPVRTVAGIDYGTREYNRLTQPIQDSLIGEILQMPHLEEIVD